MRYKWLNTIVLFVGFVTFFSCTTEHYDLSPRPSFNLIVKHAISDVPLLHDSIMYKMPMGEPFEVTRIWYYISGVSLIKDNGELIPIERHVFIDGKTDFRKNYLLNQASNISGIEFTFGLYPEINHHDSLPALTENNDMIWPTQMGGGYHFMKYEGHYINSSGETKGFAMHLGENGYQFKVVLQGSVSKVNGIQQITLNMDLLNWFQNPELYDFDKDGNYSMGIADNMRKLTKNGSDVFSIGH